jgi:hypothetical protein
VSFRAFMILANINSQIVHVFGFMRLGRMPKSRNGIAAMPRNGTGMRMCCQQPMQIFAGRGGSGVAMSFLPQRRA